MIRKIHIFCVLLLLLYACDPCKDCGIPLKSEPSVLLSFVNADSINQLEMNLVLENERENELNKRINILTDTILFVRQDTLRKINILIENGEDLEEERQKILDVIENLEEEKASKIMKKDTINNRIKEYNNAINILYSGWTFINSIEILESGEKLIFIDTATVYEIPLSYDQSFNTYIFTVNHFKDTIYIDYTITEELNENRAVIKDAKDISIDLLTQNAFDSLAICSEVITRTTCNENENIFILYF